MMATATESRPISKAFEQESERLAELRKRLEEAQDGRQALEATPPLDAEESVEAAAEKLLRGDPTGKIQADPRDAEQLAEARTAADREIAILAEAVRKQEGIVDVAFSGAVKKQVRGPYSDLVANVCKALIALDEAMTAECEFRHELANGPVRADLVKLNEVMNLMPTTDAMGLGFLSQSYGKATTYIDAAVRHGHFVRPKK